MCILFLQVPSVTLSLAVMVLSFLPATNLLFYVGFVVAERVLYIPSIGLCLLVGHGMTKFPFLPCWSSVASVSSASTTSTTNGGKRKIAVICALACILLASFGLRTLRRNQDWKDEERLYRAGIPINPAKGKMRARLVTRSGGLTLTKKGSFVQNLVCSKSKVISRGVMFRRLLGSKIFK